MAVKLCQSYSHSVATTKSPPGVFRQIILDKIYETPCFHSWQRGPYCDAQQKLLQTWTREQPSKAAAGTTWCQLVIIHNAPRLHSTIFQGFRILVHLGFSVRQKQMPGRGPCNCRTTTVGATGSSTTHEKRRRMLFLKSIPLLNLSYI